jgi:hypothetical protein
MIFFAIPSETARSLAGMIALLPQPDRLAAPAWPRRGWVTRARLALCHGIGGDLFCKADGLLFECLANQNPFSLRWIITLCVVEAHRDPSPNWLGQHIWLLVALVSTDGRTIDKDRGEGWARSRRSRITLSQSLRFERKRPWPPALRRGYPSGHVANKMSRKPALSMSACGGKADIPHPRSKVR